MGVGAKATDARRARAVAATAAVTGVVVRRVAHGDRHGARRLLGQRQERVTLGTAQAAAGVFAQEKDDEGEDQTEANRDGEWDDGHGGLSGGEVRSGGRDTDLGATTGAAVVVPQEFFCSQPVVEFDALQAAPLHPEMVGGFLDFSLGWLVSRSGSGFFHGRRG